MTLRGSADQAIEAAADEAGSGARLEALRPGLRLLALRHLDGDAEAADEAVQETIVRALTALRARRLEDPDRLTAFVRGIARHVLADVGRARRTVALDDQLPDAGADPLGTVVSEEERRAVRAALATLPEADQELLRVCFFEGLTPAEIAVRLGEPADRIRKRKSRALERLRAAFHGSMSRPARPADKQEGGLSFH